MAAQWTCQTCGRPCRPKGLSVADFAGQLPEEWRSQLYDGGKCKSQRFTLTVAHVDPDPQNCNPENLVAECAPCHLRRDAKMHRLDILPALKGEDSLAAKQPKL